MEKLKPTLEAIDLFVKIVLAVLVFFLFGVERDRLDIQKKQLDVEAAQLDIQQRQQTSNLIVAERIIALIFEERNKCIAEDQAFMIDFLIDNNNFYNVIKIDKEDFYRASAARRHCSTGPIAQDAKVSASMHEGAIPVLTSQGIEKTRKTLEGKGVVVETARGVTEKPSGYVAVGVYSEVEKSFRNFRVPGDSVKPDRSITANTVIRPRWSVYLRANTSNTEEGSNPILGVVNENACVKVLQSFPALRGQTWAAVKLVPCP